jgi:hypothetical protein
MNRQTMDHPGGFQQIEVGPQLAIADLRPGRSRKGREPGCQKSQREKDAPTVKSDTHESPIAPVGTYGHCICEQEAFDNAN